jgi:hypothetical protein
MSGIQFRIIDDAPAARTSWERFSPHVTIDDEWDFREIWTKGLNFPFHFIVGSDRDNDIGLLPLTLNTVKGLGAKYLRMREPFLEFFGGIDIDDTKVWVAPGYEHVIPDFLRQVRTPAKLTYLREPYNFDSLESTFYLDRYELDLRPLSDIDDFMQKNLKGRSRQRLRNRLHRIDSAYTTEIRQGTEDDLDRLFRLSIERFGERSSFNLEQRQDAFRGFLGRFVTDLFHIDLDGVAQAVSMGILHNHIYTTLSIGYDLHVRDLSKYLIVSQIKRALELNCTKFDAGKGENGWKSHFNLTRIPQYNLVLNYAD